MKNNKYSCSLILVAFLQLSTLASGQSVPSSDSTRYFDGQSFAIIGRFHNEGNYHRFPAEYKDSVRKDVWDLSLDCTGISVRFATNSPYIKVRWQSLSSFSMDHMASTGVRGVDLYAMIDGEWRYVSTGRVKGKENEYMLIQTNRKEFREYLLNLSLYNGIDSLYIGIKSDADISKPKKDYLTAKKPVVYYGTSIAQGGCASRPGLAFTNILSRKLDRAFINFGFSGNGNCEMSVGNIMCRIDAALYVLDCNPNTRSDEVYDRTVNLVRLLKKRRPETPVLLVESIRFENILSGSVAMEPVKKNAELYRAYKFLKGSGIRGLYYKKSDGMIGFDHEGTVDGIHPNDIGMLRMAESLEPVIEKIIR
ncbi:MAG TPA: SGNH/GDSL hydrolase family protein [Bacteroidales bacterium]|nr:SGNH/GDSL hydrolase family protein [Bacteroidales bacterium]